MYWKHIFSLGGLFLNCFTGLSWWTKVNTLNVVHFFPYGLYFKAVFICYKYILLYYIPQFNFYFLHLELKFLKFIICELWNRSNTFYPHRYSIFQAPFLKSVLHCSWVLPLLKSSGHTYVSLFLYRHSVHKVCFSYWC